eukprot:8630028-Ditylum_brightwellii.AAC.1
MIFKESGNIEILCLQAILLLETDYKWVLPEIVNCCLLGHAFSHGVIPKEMFGGVEDGMWAGGVASIDASNCYDWLSHNVASMATQQWGMFQHTIFLLLFILCIMAFTIRTGHGTSTTSYGGTWEDLSQTLYQGAGSAPGIWLCTSAVLVSFLHDRGHAMSLATSLSALTIIL